MIFSSQSKINRTKRFLSRIFRSAAERLFLTTLVLVFISLVAGLILFYKYSILSQKAEPEVGAGIIGFQENLYQEIIEEWQSRGERFEQALTKEYPDLFRELTKE